MSYTEITIVSNGSVCILWLCIKAGQYFVVQKPGCIFFEEAFTRRLFKTGVYSPFTDYLIYIFDL